MKIGEVAKKYGLSKDALRYYIKSGLLIPEGAEKYARCKFKARDLEDLELILRMKEQRFQLKDIMTALTLRRTSNMIEPQTIQAYAALYEGKKRELREQIEELHRALESIEREEARFSAKEAAVRPRVDAPSRQPAGHCGDGVALARLPSGGIWRSLTPRRRT